MVISSTLLGQIRDTLSTLESYELPEKYREPNKGIRRTDPIPDPETQYRYHKARQTYLRSQMNDLFIDHMGAFDGRTRMCRFPPVPHIEDQEKLRVMRDNVRVDLRKSVITVRDHYQGINDKFRHFCLKREQLQRVVRGMENSTTKGTGKPRKENKEEDGVDMDSYPDKNEVTRQEEELKSLTNTRVQLETKLRKIRMETREVEVQVNNTKDMVKELVGARGGDESEVRDVLSQNIKLETEVVRRRVQELKDMSYYYESMRIALEELGGMKIVSVFSANPASREQSNDDVFDGITQNKMDYCREITCGPRWSNLSGSISTVTESNIGSSSSSSSKSQHNFLYINVLLLDKHLVMFTLFKSEVSKLDLTRTGVIFRVKDARLLTPTVLSHTLPDTKENYHNPTKIVSVTIPPLHDLVRISSNMEPVQDLRFLVRETIARIRTFATQLDTMAQLRAKYITKISEAAIRTDYGNGREDQEVICILKTCVTVVIRLTGDCPLLKGSAYIHEIVGLGGCDETLLQTIKSRVNAQNIYTPLDIMDCLLAEIIKSNA